MKDKFLYYLIISIRGFLRILPQVLREKFLNFLAFLFYTLDKKHRLIIEANLQFAFDGKYSKEELERIGKKVFQNFLFYLCDFLLGKNRTKEDIEEILEIKNDVYLKEALKNNEKIILISAHFCNFELSIKSVGCLYHPLTIVREKLYNSPSLTKLLMEYVETMNVKAVPKIGAVRHLVKAMKEGRMLALAVDQNTESKHGILIDFFGKKARHTATASQLARRFNATMIPVFVTTKDRKKYTLEFFPPIKTIKTDNEEDDILKMTQAQADITEKMAREHVEDYFWLHKRFKNQYPEIYP